MVETGQGVEIAQAFNQMARGFVAKGAPPLLVSGAMISAAVGFVVQSGKPTSAADMLRRIADRIDPPVRLTEP